MVSVIMITYGHENYIHQAIEGVLMQQCDFEIELIIADDRSPDQTETIIKDIIANHPNGKVIKYIRHKVNKGMSGNMKWALLNARNKYIAYCEGDDYWTDPFKLQKQVDFLEMHPDYSLVCGSWTRINAITGEENNFIHEISKNKRDSEHPHNGFTFSLMDTLGQWITQPLTMCFRKGELSDLFKILPEYKFFRDVHLSYHLLKKGNGFYFKEAMGVYRQHLGGVFSGISSLQRYTDAVSVYKELHLHNKDSFTRRKYFKAIVRYIRSIKNSEDLTYKPLSLFFEGIRLANNWKERKEIFKEYLKYKINYS